jgi:hypothetical protein
VRGPSQAGEFGKSQNAEAASGWNTVTFAESRALYAQDLKDEPPFWIIEIVIAVIAFRDFWKPGPSLGNMRLNSATGARCKE